MPALSLSMLAVTLAFDSKHYGALVQAHRAANMAVDSVLLPFRQNCIFIPGLVQYGANYQFD